MARQLDSAIPHFIELSDIEQKVFVRKIRYDKYVLKPALQIRKKATTKKKAKKAVKKVTPSMKAVLQAMSPEQIQELLKNSK